jgi:hypothetical protein
MELWTHLVDLFWTLFQLVVLLLWFALLGAPIILWVAWWLWAVDWPKFWPTLAEGAWAVLVLLALVVAMALTFLIPGSQTVAGVDVPSPWWQLGAVSVAVAVMFLCGWLQGVLGWYPPEPQPGPAAGHGHGHGHHHAHAHEQHGGHP